MDARELLEMKLQRRSQQERDGTQRVLATLRKVDRQEMLDKDERMTARLLVNRGLIGLEQTGPGFGDVKMKLTEASDKFRRLF